MNEGENNDLIGGIFKVIIDSDITFFMFLLHFNLTVLLHSFLISVFFLFAGLLKGKIV